MAGEEIGNALRLADVSQHQLRHRVFGRPRRLSEGAGRRKNRHTAESIAGLIGSTTISPFKLTRAMPRSPRTASDGRAPLRVAEFHPLEGEIEARIGFEARVIRNGSALDAMAVAILRMVASRETMPGW